MPLTIDFASGFYFHREGPGLLLGMADPDQTPGFRCRPTAWIEPVLEVAERRCPALRARGSQGGWGGYYEVTPRPQRDDRRSRASRRFLYATGFSGHGFLQAPAAGEILRDLVLGRQALVDVTALSAERFARAESRPERNVI